MTEPVAPRPTVNLQPINISPSDLLQLSEQLAAVAQLHSAQMAQTEITQTAPAGAAGAIARLAEQLRDRLAYYLGEHA